MPGLGHLRMYARFAAGLPAFLAGSSSIEAAQALLAERLAGRAESFLTVARRGIFDHPGSPYLPLLQRAGCGFEDLRAMVRGDGLETALAALRRDGVYISFEEWKGRRPVVRGDLELAVSPHSFDNPHLRQAYEATTGGSTGAGTRLALDLDDLAARAPISFLMQHAQGLAELPRAIVFGTLPDPTGVNIVLSSAHSGRPIDRWFCPVIEGRPRAPLQYRLTHHYVVEVGRLLGAAIPRPEPLALDRLSTVARWAERTSRQQGGAVVSASASMAVRIASAALESGLDLEGVVFGMGGEPVTPAKTAAVEATGATCVANYHMSEVGAIGRGCPLGADPNDQHFLKDHLALIQWPRTVGTFEVQPFLLTTLLPTAKRILLNVEVDDHGKVEASSCGCPLERYGLTECLRDVRSFGKLTAEGVTLVGSEMEHVLENLLPARFGGTPLDYQLVEEEDGDRLTRVVVVVHPRLGPVDERAIVDAVLDGLRGASLGAAMSAGVWDAAGALRVRRAEPILTARGKLLPLHFAHDARQRASDRQRSGATSR